LRILFLEFLLASTLAAICSGVTREGEGGERETVLGDTLQGVTPDLKLIFVVAELRKDTE